MLDLLVWSAVAFRAFLASNGLGKLKKAKEKKLANECRRAKTFAGSLCPLLDRCSDEQKSFITTENDYFHIFDRSQTREETERVNRRS